MFPYNQRQWLVKKGEDGTTCHGIALYGGILDLFFPVMPADWPVLSPVFNFGGGNYFFLINATKYLYVNLQASAPMVTPS
jgi:hypothetical protein